MLLLFNPRKSYRHPALRVYRRCAISCVLSAAGPGDDDWTILDAKVQNLFDTMTYSHQIYTLFNRIPLTKKIIINLTSQIDRQNVLNNLV